jgi:hypothetical protein
MNMTDKESFPDELLDRGADDPPDAHPDGRRWTSVLVHRWPTALGLAVAALTVFDLRSGTELAALTMLMPMVYLGAAALDRRRFAWVVLLAGVAVLTVAPPSSEVVLSVGFLAAAHVFFVVGAARGELRKSGGLALQTVGMLAFGSIVLADLYVDAYLGVYLVAIALVGHAAWDAHHLVARSYAEWCAVVDVLAGAAIVLGILVRQPRNAVVHRGHRTPRGTLVCSPLPTTEYRGKSYARGISESLYPASSVREGGTQVRCPTNQGKERWEVGARDPLCPRGPGFEPGTAQNVAAGGKLSVVREAFERISVPLWV